MSLGFLNPETQAESKSEKHAVLLEVSGQIVLTEMEIKTCRGRTFLNQKSQTIHLFLQLKLNVKSHVLNLNACVFVYCSKAQLQRYKCVWIMTVSRNTSHDFGFKVQNANWVCCLRVCPASRIYMPIWNLNPQLNPTCVWVCVSSWLMVV